jgi:signal peptidase II
MRLTLSAALVVFTVFLDQLTKWLALTYVDPHNPIEVLPFFNFVLTYNTGISFGMLKTVPTPYALAALSSIISLIMLVWLIRTKRKDLSAALSLLIGGAIGNIIDRFTHGAVVDFLDFYYKDWHYPAFNIADSAIVLGIAFLLFDSLFLEHRKGNVSNENTD